MYQPRPRPQIEAILEQLRWIEEHGGDLAGYVARYGRHDDPNRSGDGGTAIFAADANELLRLINRACR